MKLYLLMIFLSLGACSGLPKGMQEIQGTDVPYIEVNQNTENYKGALVRWGGIIIDVENEEDFSLIQAMFYPLDYTGRPQSDSAHGGRFVIKSSEFLDPVVYAKDNEITVVGALNGDIARTVGKKTIRVPLLLSAVIHQWPHRNQYNGYGGYYGPYGGFGGYGSYFRNRGHPFYFGRHHRGYW